MEMSKKVPFLRQEPTSSSDKPKRGKHIATPLLKYTRYISMRSGFMDEGIGAMSLFHLTSASDKDIDDN